ncbi:MAG: ABC transporter permease [Oscillospiraceae bacterium]|nr:ABC transporter permease [Oscillospiraceae bacterium]
MNVANKKIIRKLTLRFMAAGKTRNVIAVVAIMLTCLMFTAVFTIGANMAATIQEQTMRQIGMSAHGGFKRISAEQYEHVAMSPLITDISYRKSLALAENDELIKLYSEISYAENSFAEWYFSEPTTGKMPGGFLELATSTLVLDALGVPHEIGAEVPLEFSVSGRKYAQSFTLSGYWEGDPIHPAQNIWLSKEYVDSVVAENVIEKDEQIAGQLQAALFFKNSFNIEGKMERLVAERGYVWGDGYDEEQGYGAGNEVRPGINWAYMTNEVDPSLTAIAGLALFLILLSGYFIIYSIFVISVNADIHFYGLLKTMGATGRQLKRIVRTQALLLSLFGIPAGLILGYISGIMLTPALMQTTIYGGEQTNSANPLIFIFAALFSLITVFEGCRKPCKFAAKVSPIEAVKYSGVSGKFKKKAKKTHRVSPFSMALANVLLQKRKFFAIVISLSLSLIMLNSAYSAAQSFDMDKYLENSLVTDFAVTDATVLNYGIVDSVNDSITHEFLNELEEHGITEYGCVYFEQTMEHKLTEKAYENFIRFFDAKRESIERYFGYAIPEFERAIESGEIALQVYGLGQVPLNTFYSDYEKLNSGDYVLVFADSSADNEEILLYEKGDKIALVNSGESREFEVLDVIWLDGGYPYSLSIRFSLMTGWRLVLADDIFLDFYGEKGAMQVNFNVDDEKIPEIESFLFEYTTKTNSNLEYVSRATYIEEFESLRSTYIVMGGTMAFILALIGILNFTNSTIAAIMSRRRELAMLQSVGMTGKQLRATLFSEGLCYTALTAIFTFTAGLGIVWLIVKVIAGQTWFFSQSFTIAPSLYCLPPLILISAAVPIICYARLSREVLVERLRVE